MIIPSYLKKGDTVNLVAPASVLPRNKILKGIKTLEDWGLAVKPGKYLFESEGSFAGNDRQRMEDLQHAIDDVETRAIIMARGGYGTTRILDSINFDPLINNPKWVVGFSDITALHIHLAKIGLASIHGPMPSFYYHPEHRHSTERLKKHLFGIIQNIETVAYNLNRSGEGMGILIGGNLTLLCHLSGTHSDIDYYNKILFIEDTGEYLYNIDRMMIQLKRSGKLEHLAGLVVGQFSDLKDTQHRFGKTAYEIIGEAVAPYNYPVAFNFPIGHVDENYCLLHGVHMRLTAERDKPAILTCLKDKTS